MSAVCAQNIHKTKYSSGTKTKLTSEENLLVGVEGVDDEGEELVDISREGVAFSVGGLLAEGRGIRKNCVAGCAQNTSAVRECCGCDIEREDNEGHECIFHRVDGRKVEREGGYGWGQEGHTNLLTTATRHGRPPILALVGIFHLLCPPGSK
jgi:hypothetical protein